MQSIRRTMNLDVPLYQIKTLTSADDNDDLRSECQRIAYNLLRLTNKTNEWQSISSEYALREIFSTVKCTTVYGKEANDEMSAVRTKYQEYISPVRLNRILDFHANNIDKHLAEQSLIRFNAITNHAALSCCEPLQKVKYWIELPRMKVLKR